MIIHLLKLTFYKLYLNIVGAVYVLKEQVWDRHRTPNIPGKVSISHFDVTVCPGSSDPFYIVSYYFLET